MNRFFSCAVLLGCATATFAGDTTATLTQADQAFALADYKIAVGLYKQVDGKLKDPSLQATLTEHLQFAEKQLAQSPAPAASTTQPAGAAAAVGLNNVPSSASNRVPHVRPKDGETLETTLHQLGNFDYNEDDDKSIPADVTKLSGATVKIPGVMFPLDQSGRVTRFLLVNDMMSCCYGTAPKLQHVAYVQMPKDKWMAATTDRIVVEGTLKVDVKRDDGFVMSIFEIDPTSIKFVGQ